MNGFKIESNVSAPARNLGLKFPIDKLKMSTVENGRIVGQSILIPNKRTTDVSNDLYKAARMLGAKVTLRQFDDGVRVYRIPARLAA